MMYSSLKRLRFNVCLHSWRTGQPLIEDFSGAQVKEVDGIKPRYVEIPNQCPAIQRAQRSASAKVSGGACNASPGRQLENGVT